MVKPNASREFIAQSGLALPVGLEAQLRAMKEQIDGKTHRKKFPGEASQLKAMATWLATL